MDCIAKAEEYLRKQYCQVCPNGPDLVIRPPLDRLEAQYFLEGLEQDIFCIDSEGYVQTQLLPPRSGKNKIQKSLQIFWHDNAGHRFLFREGVCQLSTAVALIRKYGWNINQIEMEPSKAKFGPLAYAVDILINEFDRSGTTSILACVEVKRDSRSLQKLIDGFLYCCGVGPHGKEQCLFKLNHAKYNFCSIHKPLYFAAVAPGREICFKLSQTGKLSVEEETHGLIYATDVPCRDRLRLPEGQDRLVGGLVMDQIPIESVTFWLGIWHGGSEVPMTELTRLIYGDLCRLAAHRRQAHGAAKVQANALFREIYLRMSSVQELEAQGRQFTDIASNIMRCILIDHARKRQTARTGVAFEEVVSGDGDETIDWELRRMTESSSQRTQNFEDSVAAPDLDVLGVDRALQRMAASKFFEPAQVMKLSFFCGLGWPEIAELLRVPLPTVERDWSFAQAWLEYHLSDSCHGN